MFFYLLSCFLGGILALFAFIYFLKQGQFDDIEEVKYRVFHDEERK